MKEWDDQQATFLFTQWAGPLEQKQYEIASFMNIRGGKYKSHLLGANSLSSTYVNGPLGYIQIESSSYLSMDWSHRLSTFVNNVEQLKDYA